MFIRTERLMLRPVFPEDWREIYAGIAEEGIVRMLASAPWPYRPEDARARCGRPARVGEMRFAITVPGADGAPLIGQVGIGPFEDGSQHELGYWIGSNWQGRGYATEAVRGVLETARALGMERVDAGHFIDNPISGKVLRNCGFVSIGNVEAIACAGRGGDIVEGVRYVCELGVPEMGKAA